MPGRGVEDNAVVTVTSTDGAIGVIETGFVTPTSPFSIEIQGTTGSLQYGLGAEGGMSVDVGNGHVAVEVHDDAANPFAQLVALIRYSEELTSTITRHLPLKPSV